MPIQDERHKFKQAPFAEMSVSLPLQIIEGKTNTSPNWARGIESSGPNFTAIPGGRDIKVSCSIQAIELDDSMRLNSVLKTNPFTS